MSDPFLVDDLVTKIFDHGVRKQLFAHRLNVRLGVRTIVAVELELDTAKPVVLHGEAGLSRKGREPGNASYYFSLTRLPTRGTVTIGYKTLEVQGTVASITSLTTATKGA